MMYTPVAGIGSASGSIDSVNLSTMQRKSLLRLSSINGGTMSLSPDGRTVALLLSVRSGGAATSKITLVATDGTGERQLFEDQHPSDLKQAYGIAWSPDGKHVYFAREGSGNQCDLWRMPVNSSSPEATGVRAPMLRAMNIGPNGELTFAGGFPEQFELWALDNLQRIVTAGR
jgi:Tol biopolymer transport system component